MEKTFWINIIIWHLFYTKFVTLGDFEKNPKISPKKPIYFFKKNQISDFEKSYYFSRNFVIIWWWKTFKVRKCPSKSEHINWRVSLKERLLWVDVFQFINLAENNKEEDGLFSSGCECL